MNVANRGRRGGARNEMSADGDDEVVIERPEDDIIVTDQDGNPLTDDQEEPVIAAIEADDNTDHDQDDEDPIEVLKREKAAITAARDAEAARVVELERRVQNVQADQNATTKALLDHAVATAKNELAEAKRKFTAAMAAGNHAAAADAQEEIAAKTIEVSQFSSAKDEFEAEAARPAPKQTSRTPAASHTEKVEAYIATLTPKQQEFARKHRDKIFPEGDPKPLQKVYALSNVAAIDYGADTPEFFDYIEQQMGLNAVAKEPKNQKQQRRKAPPVAAAPVSRGQAPVSGNTVTLSKDEVAMAKRLHMTPARYALHKKTAHERAGDPDYRGPRYSKDDPALSGRR